jgi:hypothetical protein
VYPRLLMLSVVSVSYLISSQVLGRMSYAATADFIILLAALVLLAFPLLSQRHYERTSYCLTHELSKSQSDSQREGRHLRSLLHTLLPLSVIDQLLSGREIIADPYDDVTILFTDMKGFTAYSSRIQPSELVDFLNTMYSAFDEILEKFHLYVFTLVFNLKLKKKL